MNKFMSLYNEQSGQTTASTDRPSHQRLAQQAVSRAHHLQPVGRRYISLSFPFLSIFISVMCMGVYVKPNQSPSLSSARPKEDMTSLIMTTSRPWEKCKLAQVKPTCVSRQQKYLSFTLKKARVDRSSHQTACLIVWSHRTQR